MKKNILTYLNQLESYKTAIKELHWHSPNYSQHHIADDIANLIAEFQDTIAEIEQGIHGNIKFNQLKPSHYEIKSMVKFLKDVISNTTSFYKTVTGDEYIGMRSEIETFLGQMQKQLYLINFTIKEDRRRREETIMEMKQEKIQYVVLESTNGDRVKLTESEFKELIRDSVNNAMNQ